MLSAEEQAVLVDIIRNRLIQQRRAELIAEVLEAREAYEAGEVTRGSVGDLLRELDS